MNKLFNPNVSYRSEQRLYDELEQFLITNQTCARAAKLIETFTLTNVKTRNAKKFLNSYVQKYFIPFLKSVLKQIIITGWCAYKIVQHKDKAENTQHKIPKIVPSEFLSLVLNKDDEKMTYTIQVLDTNLQEVKGVKILMINELETYAINGVVNSVMSGILGDLRYERQIRAFSLQAEYVRSNPTVFLQPNADEVDSNAKSNGETILARGGVGGQMNQASVSLNSQISRVSTAAVDTLEKASTTMASNVEFHANQMYEVAQRDSFKSQKLGLGFAPQYINNIYIVPPGLRLPYQPHLPQARQDYTQMDRNLSLKIAQGFGIPDSLLGLHVRTTYRESTSLQQEKLNPVNAVTFQNTIDLYTVFFQQTFVSIYYDIFKVILKQDVIQFDVPPLWQQLEIDAMMETQNEIEEKEKKKRKLNEHQNIKKRETNESESTNETKKDE